MTDDDDLRQALKDFKEVGKTRKKKGKRELALVSSEDSGQPVKAPPPPVEAQPVPETPPKNKGGRPKSRKKPRKLTRKP